MVYWLCHFLFSWLFLLPLGQGSWRWMLISGALPIVLLLLARLNMPESPHWLIKQGRHKEANTIVEKVFGQGVVVSHEEREAKRPV